MIVASATDPSGPNSVLEPTQHFDVPHHTVVLTKLNVGSLVNVPHSVACPAKNNRLGTGRLDGPLSRPANGSLERR